MDRQPTTPQSKSYRRRRFVLNLTQALQAEVGERGIRVQAVLPGGTRTEIWERAGIDLSSYPPELIMEMDEMVDAALAGLDQGELITIPSLPDAGEWEAFTAARLALGPNLSGNHPAKRHLFAAASSPTGRS